MVKEYIEEDIGQRVINKLEELNVRLDKTCITAKKNSHLHFMINTNLLKEMKKRAESQGISLSEWCRKKLVEDSQLDRIEKKLDKICE